MPPKRKKIIGKTKPQAFRSQGKKKSDQPADQITTTGHPSPATQPANTASVTTSSETRNAQTQSLLFMLPLEIRVLVYSHVLASKDLEIGERRILRRQRYNEFTLANFDSKHFALLKTCTEIKKEVEKFILPKLAFTFLSLNAFANFLGRRTGYSDSSEEIDDHAFKLLTKIANVEFVIDKQCRWYWCRPFHAMDWVVRTLEHPLNIEIVDHDSDEGYTSRTYREAVRKWDKRIQELEALQTDS